MFQNDVPNVPKVVPNVPKIVPDVPEMPPLQYGLAKPLLRKEAGIRLG